MSYLNILGCVQYLAHIIRAGRDYQSRPALAKATPWRAAVTKSPHTIIPAFGHARPLHKWRDEMKHIARRELLRGTGVAALAAGAAVPKFSTSRSSLARVHHTSASKHPVYPIHGFYHRFVLIIRM